MTNRPQILTQINTARTLFANGEWEGAELALLALATMLEEEEREYLQS